MKKSIKSVLAKSLAVAMAFSLAGIAPTSGAASKKPSLTKKVTVNVGKKKTVKVTSKKKVKKTTWSLKKGGNKVVSLSKKKAKSVVVKGKKKGSTTLTARIKVGSKTYKKTCKITVKKAATVKPTAKVTVTPTNNGGNNNGGNNTKPTPKPTEKPVDTFKTDKGVMTVNEADTWNIPLTALNETTATSQDKRGDSVTAETKYNNDGSVCFVANTDDNSGVSFYINPCTSDKDLVPAEENEDRLVYNNGTKDVSAYDYIRIKVTTDNELNVRPYNDVEQFATSAFPGNATCERYEGNAEHASTWFQAVDADIWDANSTYPHGKGVKEEYKTRTIFISIASLIELGMDPEKMAAIAFCPQDTGAEVTIHRLDLVKVKYDKKVTGIEVTSDKTQIAPGKKIKVKATVTPEDATRQIVKWSSSDTNIAKVDARGNVIAKEEGEVTITATSTDGSNVTGSIKIKVTEASDEQITTHEVDLSKVQAKANTGSSQVAASQAAACIEFAAGANQVFVNFKKYLDDNDLILRNYDSLQVVWEVRDAAGKAIADYSGDVANAPTSGKIAYVDASHLNGYGDGIDTNYEGSDDTIKDKAYFDTLTGQTCTLTIAKTNSEDLPNVAGFNLWMDTMPSTYHLAVKSITLVKE